MEVTNWGKYPTTRATLEGFDSLPALKTLLHSTPKTIPRGMGRCYGDSSLQSHITSTLRFNRIVDFDPKQGVICCEAGVTFAELLEVFVPRGWFPPVTPGTKFITLGGAVASDVHGKNHHKEGSFSAHLLALKLMLPNGNLIDCSPQKNSELFWLTCGGMGLTGMIIYVTFQLKSIETAYIRQESLRARNLQEIMDAFEHSQEWTYTVAWIDCLASGSQIGRSLLMKGEHALRSELTSAFSFPLTPQTRRKFQIPFDFPKAALNPFNVKAFNGLYYHKHPKRPLTSLIDYDRFFYPLDAIHHWNRIYGKHGFVQYQFVLPKDASREGLQTILSQIAHKGMGSFLAVLKLFGPQSGMLSFPMEGYTLALDFAIRSDLFPFLEELDRMILDHGGRIYLAKDARMKADFFLKSYTNANAFIQKLQPWNPDFKFCSLQSERLGLTSL